MADSVLEALILDLPEWLATADQFHKRCSSKVSCWLSLKSAVRDSEIPVQLFLQHNRDIAPFQQLLFERGNSLFTTSELGFWKYLWEL